MPLTTDRVQPGKLQYRVHFDRPPTTKGPSGQIVGDWEFVATLWAEIEPITGSVRAIALERVVAGGEVGSADTWIRIRYSQQAAAIAPNWRARFRDQVYDIKAVADVNMSDRKIEITAQSGVSQG